MVRMTLFSLFGLFGSHCMVFPDASFRVLYLC